MHSFLEVIGAAIVMSLALAVVFLGVRSALGSLKLPVGWRESGWFEAFQIVGVFVLVLAVLQVLYLAFR
jgi:hypothetical protein